ncbi:MAG: exodeoxyribonuclease VII large subunit [Actinomycetota bacterium]|nr:exodeoxyribonuclease VII large subunit [Actinomycetota bacterium]
MAFESSPEQPAPVRTVSRMVGEWIGRLGAVWMDGQIAELRPRPGARNIYLVLRDPDVDMSLTVVADAALIGGVSPPLEQGQRILVHAKPEYWTGRGNLQFRAKEIRPVGLGTLLEQLERLRALLAAEGIFSPERKKALPFLPRRIGLVCGRNSAAMHDVLVNVEDRWPGIPFEVREVAVQGVQAVAGVTEAVQELDAISDVDVIVIARGGGSVEDLLPFSNESLVRAVAACRTPVVSAIGHEQDAPLLDLVADFRASTPTDAAKRIVPSWQEQFSIISALQARAFSIVSTRLERESTLVDDTLRRIRARVAAQIDGAGQDIEHLAARVRALSPAATLDRGYAIVTTTMRDIIRDPGELAIGQQLRVQVAKGSFAVEVRQNSAEES